MTRKEKLGILAMAARYDASCSSSGSDRANSGGTGNASLPGICHSWADDGRCVSLLKLLLSNSCAHDCAYCVNRRSNDIPRATLTPEEVAEITIEFYLRNYIEGLFLSSAVVRSPDYSMELMIRAVKILRHKNNFNGYIHLKVMPGADPRLIQEAGLLADRISANIELPSSQGLELLAPDKHPALVMGSIKGISAKIRENKDERKAYQNAPSFAPAGQSTQLIVGATPDTDKTIITLSESLYQKLSLKRVYYSAFIPVSNDSRLPAILTPPLKREHRLYQADWLLRFYGFSASEILDEAHPNLDMEVDPKVSWALRHPSFFPVEVNRASYEEILRIPGVGVKSAMRIVQARRQTTLGFDELKRLGVVLKRAQYFVTCKGKSIHRGLYPEAIMADLVPGQNIISKRELREGQMSLFRPEQNLLPFDVSQEI
ncbi:MAG TPA: putative DNA modification/repair radical SAM protein [Spirochaetota bacterium]